MERDIKPTYDELESYVENLQKQLADAQATVEALQRERDHAKKMEAVQKEVADNQTWHVRELTATLDAERHENMKQLEELRQQVGELQREKDEANEVVEALASKVAEQSIELNGDPQNFHGRGRTIGLRASLTQLQGLVRALPMPEEGGFPIVEVDGDYYVNHTSRFSTKDEAEAYAKLLAYRATLDATTPAGGGTR